MKKIFLIICLIFTSCYVLCGCNSTNNLNDTSDTNVEENNTQTENLDYVFHDKQGLAFYPLDDGTFAVSVGNARFLTSIEIPATFKDKSVTKIVADFPFDNNTNIFDEVESIIISNGLLHIGDYAFTHFINLKSIIIPNSVISIGNKAFNMCKNLTSIRLSNNLLNIGDYCFYGCENLTYNISKGLNYIGSIENPYQVLISLNSKTNSSYEINEKTVFIVEEVFRDCSNLENITLSKNIKTISALCFCDCQNLISVTFQENSIINSIGSSSFSYCRNLKTINLPKTLTFIGQKAFYYCNSLELLEIENIKIINEETFSGCYNLSLILDANIEKIMAYNFNVKYTENSMSTNPTIKKTTIFFKGTRFEWSKIEKMTNNSEYYLYFFSESEAINCWHYDLDNKTPILWQ